MPVRHRHRPLLHGITARQRHAVCRVMYRLRDRQVPAADIATVWGSRVTTVFRWASDGVRHRRVGSRA